MTYCKYWVLKDGYQPRPFEAELAKNCGNCRYNDEKLDKCKKRAPSK